MAQSPRGPMLFWVIVCIGPMPFVRTKLNLFFFSFNTSNKKRLEKNLQNSLKMSSFSVITPEDVLETLMNDGTIDSIRLKIINQLKANEELKSNTIKMVEQSKVLNTPGAEKQTKRELFDALRQELETPVLEKASRSVWELILDQNGLGKEISETVERVFCQLSGREPPLFPLPGSETHPEKESKESPSSSSKKRSFNDMSNK